MTQLPSDFYPEILPLGSFAGDALFTGVFLGLFPGDLLFRGLFPGDLLLGVFLGLLAFTGLSSVIDAALGIARECLLIKPFNGEPSVGADLLRGVAPLLSGVDAGIFLSNNSGLNFGPNDTLFLFDAGSGVSPTFRFCPGCGDLPTKENEETCLDPNQTSANF